MQPIRIFARVRKRKIIYFSFLLVLIIAAVVVLAVNIFRTSRKTKAAITCDTGTPKNCTLDSDTTLTENDPQFDNSNLTIDGKILTIAGRHTFENLTIRNGGAVRSQPLDSASDFDKTSGEITATGANKFIDLVVKSKLEISNSGVITAAGTGYPTGSAYSANPNWPNWRGYGPDAAHNGPGGGRNQLGVAGFPRAAGGGSAGAGGDGNDNGTVVPATGGVGYNNSSTTTSAPLPGSAGGIAYRTVDSHESSGGAGGGVIKISTNVFEIFNNGLILADGASPANCLLTSSCGGAGGGGAIYLEYQESNSQIKVDVSAGNGLASTPGQNGLYLAEGAILNGSVTNITARGGAGSDGTNFISGPGGGGRVVIIKKQKPLASIKKSLSKICDADNPGPGYPNCPLPATSPYSLKPKDIIKVTLEVNNLTKGQPITIKDEYFNNGILAGNHFVVINYTATKKPGWDVQGDDSPSASEVIWRFTPTESQETLKYLLTVNN